MVLEYDSILLHIGLGPERSIEFHQLEIAQGLQGTGTRLNAVQGTQIFLNYGRNSLQECVYEGNGVIVFRPYSRREVIDSLLLPGIQVLHLRITSGKAGRAEIISEQGEFDLIAWKGIIGRREQFPGPLGGIHRIRVAVLVVQLDVQTGRQAQSHKQQDIYMYESFHQNDRLRLKVSTGCCAPMNEPDSGSDSR